ncbi:hypothetical protein [Paraburkholderia hiiakae]|uniref:hypothetical protein n=1 Tax=Paraburkholderia hiiakae TaxID=1081782 RepID=UPI00191B68CA|nr:hypothetical protein [Paraburkholderia hiiakae]
MKSLISVAIIFVASFSANAWSAGASPDALLANEIRAGCTLRVVKYNIQPADFDKYDLSLNWQCADHEQAIVDTYLSSNSDGESRPEIETVFYTKSRDVIVLVKWDENYKDTKAARYKVFAYRYVGDISDTSFVKMDRLSRNFGDGYDGILNGKRTDFSFKTAAAIRKRLAELGD